MKDLKIVGGVLVLFLVLCLLYNASVARQPVAAVGHAQNNSSTIPSGDQVVGSPTLSATAIDHILALASSPAQGLGKTLYDLSQQYHIDDAFSLAFFHHESSYGRAGIAQATHSLGNIRCTAGYACLNGYRSYSSWQEGARDWYILIQQVYIAQGLDTITKIIPVYAPGADNNDEQAYIQSVLNDVSLYRQKEIHS